VGRDLGDGVRGFLDESAADGLGAVEFAVPVSSGDVDFGGAQVAHEPAPCGWKDHNANFSRSEGRRAPVVGTAEECIQSLLALVSTEPL